MKDWRNEAVRLASEGQSAGQTLKKILVDIRGLDMQTLQVTSGSGIAVKPKEIPKHRGDALARNTLYAVERFFALPGVQEDFENWLKDYESGKKI